MVFVSLGQLLPMVKRTKPVVVSFILSGVALVHALECKRYSFLCQALVEEGNRNREDSGQCSNSGGREQTMREAMG